MYNYSWDIICWAGNFELLFFNAIGEGPASLDDVAYAVQANYLYVFGATASDGTRDTLWRLDLQCLKWSITIQQKGNRPPSSEAKMVADREERLILYCRGKIYFFSVKDGEYYVQILSLHALAVQTTDYFTLGAVFMSPSLSDMLSGFCLG